MARLSWPTLQPSLTVSRGAHAFTPIPTARRMRRETAAPGRWEQRAIRRSAPFVATSGPASTPRAGYCFDPGASTKAASTRCALVATSASLAISAERPAISECRCATLAGAGLVSVPAHERNQGSGLSGRGDGGLNARPASLLGNRRCAASTRARPASVAARVSKPGTGSLLPVSDSCANGGAGRVEVVAAYMRTR